MEDVFTGRIEGKKGHRKTTVNVAYVQYGEEDITASIRSHQKCETRDCQRLQKKAEREREG